MMLNIIKSIILNNNIVFYLCLNILSITRGVIAAPYKDKTILIKNKKKYVLGNRSLYSFDVLKDFERDIVYFKPDSISKNNYEIYDFSKIIKHKFKSNSPQYYYTHCVPENKKDIEQYLQYLNIKQGDCVLDLGANCGLTAYYLSKAVGENGRVIACEADNKNFEILQKNITMWNLKNVECINCAVWSHKTTLDFSEEVSLGSCVGIFRPFIFNSKKVQALSLMDIAEIFKLDKIDAIKMDIESSEYAVFETIDEFLTKYQPNFVIELHKNQKGIIDKKAIYNKFETNNYIVKDTMETFVFPLLYATKSKKLSPSQT